MTWLQRYKLRSFLSYSLWVVPLSGAIAAIVFHRLVWTFDMRTRWVLFDFTPDGARGLVGALSSSMLGFIVFLVSMIFLALQLSVAQLTPRIVAQVFRLPIVKVPLAIFVFTYVFTLAVLGRIGDRVPQLVVLLAVIFTVASIGVFLFLVDALGRRLRPIAICAAIAEVGTQVIDDIYPALFHAPSGEGTATGAAGDAGPMRVTHYKGRSGMFLAFDTLGIAKAAERAGCMVRLVPQVGDFIAQGDALFHVFGGGERLDEDVLHQSIALGPERTLEQDPLFAFRIIVDIAIKALSPAINDPTTGVAGIDQIHRLLRYVGVRDLGDGTVRDRGGELRLVFPTPDWEDFVRIGVSEIRSYGTGSIQIARRLRAMLEHLLRTLPPQRGAALREQLALLDRSVERGFADAEDRAAAGHGDYQGVGGVRTDRGSGV